MNKKWLRMLIVLLIYGIAFLCTYFIFQFIPHINLILKYGICNGVATMIVYIGSMMFKNGLVYHLYWGIAPMIMAPFMAYHTTGFHIFNLFILIVIEIWGLGYTINWLIRFWNQKEQDWQYTDIKKRHPKLYPIVFLFKMHLFPSLAVFLGMLPVLAYMDAFSNIDLETINVTTLFSILIALVAIGIEIVANAQMNQFKRKNNGIAKEKEIGLWKVSRHPDYFGEIMFWFSLFLFSLSVRNDLWVLVFCPLVIFLLFACMIVPLSEKRELCYNANYAEYKKRTNLFLPIFPPDSKIAEEREKRKHNQTKRSK